MPKRSDPPDVAILSARIIRAFPSLSAYSAAHLAHELCCLERAQRRHAVRCCSGEEGGYVKRLAYDGTSRMHVEHDPAAEEKAGQRIVQRVNAWAGRLAVLAGLISESAAWYDKVLMAGQEGVQLELQGDPRGRVLLLKLPGEMEASTV